MAIVVKRSLTSQEELINSNKLDWSTMGYKYEATSSIDFTSPATAYQHYYPTGWTLTFDAVVGATYKIDAYTSYLEITLNKELDFGIEIVSGATSLALTNDYQTGSQLARARSAHLIATATAASVTVRCWVAVDASSTAVRLYAGSIQSQRVA